MKQSVRKVLKTVGWVASALLLLVVLLFVLIYIPPVQKWAVDMAADYLSREMGMDVKVERVRLKFPLDLSIGGVTAIQQTDTILDCEELRLSVEFSPLLHGEVKTGEITLTDTKLNTAGMVEALTIEGHVGKLQTHDISFQLTQGELFIPALSLSNSSLHVVLADSVAADSTDEEGGALRTIRMKNISLTDVAFDLDLAPKSDSLSVGTYFGTATLDCLLDLEAGNYYVTSLKASGANVRYDRGGALPMPGFDANHIGLTGTDLDIDSLSYLATSDLYVGIRHLSGTERSGIQLDGTNGILRMDAQTLYLDSFNVRTTETDIALEMTMDLNAFDDHEPGIMSISATGFAGRNDIKQFTADLIETFDKAWPDSPLQIDIEATGNMQTMTVGKLDAQIDGAFHVVGYAVLSNLTDSAGNIGIQTNIKVDGDNLAFIKSFLPKDVAQSFNLPRGFVLEGDVQMIDGHLVADAVLRYARSSATVKANFNMNTEAYSINLVAKDFPVSSFVPMDKCIVTGKVNARGRGFNLDSQSTFAEADMNLDHVTYGTYYLDNTVADASLRKHGLKAEVKFDDERLLGRFSVDGTMTGKRLDATMDLDLPFTDLYALGLSGEPLTAHATHGDFEAHSNYGDLFLVNAEVEGIEVVLKSDSLVTEMFDLHAESTIDSTDIVLKMSDLYFDFHAPHNFFALIDAYTKVGEKMQEQVKKHDININELKQLMPEATLRANIGPQNPISKFIVLQGYKYKNVSANLRTSKEYGLQGYAHIYDLNVDSIQLDTVFFDIYQDTTQISFHAGVACPKQEFTSGFTSYLDGFISPRDADMRLTFFNGKKEKGLDIGLKGTVNEADSVLHMSIYPEHPVIGYHTFDINPDNYIDLHRHNSMFADVLLQSQDDDCSISLLAQPVDSQIQNIEAVIRHLDLEGLLAVMPFVPQMTGDLEVNMQYIQTIEGYSVDGLVAADRFTYEGTGIGDIMTQFSYNPVGEDGHNFSGMLYKDDYDILSAVGTYNVDGPDYLNTTIMMNNLPMSVASAFVPNQICAFSGTADGIISAEGPVDTLLVNGEIYPEDIHVYSDIYTFDLAIENSPITFHDSRLNFNEIDIYGAGNNPLTVNGYVDFSDLSELDINLSLYGQNFPVFESSRTKKSALFGRLNGDFFARVSGTPKDLRVRGLVNVLSTTNITYIMTNTPLTVDYRLDDIVTFVDFSAPPASNAIEPRTFMGIDMLINLEIEDGAQVRCEFSADKQSYVNVQGGGSLTMTYTPEGVLNLIGRYTMNEGAMKYTLPVIPLKTFNLKEGSYIEFTGKPANPTLNIVATEQTKASVSNADGSSRSVEFNVGLKISNTLENMGLEFTIDAPEDMLVQNELSGMTAEDKNKLAVALLATGMYLSNSNSSKFSTTNALNNFLQNEINNIAGKAVSSAVNVDMNVGVEQTRRDDGTTRTDYSFKFTKRLFSDRLNVVVGGRINADGNHSENESGAYIDDISLEWRLDNGGTQYIRIFHDKNYDNLIDGELIENGAGVLLRKKLDSLSELFIWKNSKKKETDVETK